MANRSKPLGRKFSKREQRNREEDARAREPLLQDETVKREQEEKRKRLSREEATKLVQGTWDPKMPGTAMHPDLVKGERQRKAEAVWVSPEPTDLDKLVKGETSIDYSKGKWHFPKAEEINLIDALLRYGPHHQFEQSITPPKIKLLTAKRFMLDWSASEFFGTVVMDWGRQAMMQHEMARAPYELCWIEWNSHAYVSKVASLKNELEEDLKVGFLYDHGTVTLASMTPDPRSASFLPYRMQLNVPMSAQEEAENAAFFHMDVPYYRALLLGNTGEAGKQLPVDREFIMSPEVTAMLRAHRYELNPEFKANLIKHDLPAKERQNIMFSSAGTFKQVIILLLLMTRPNKHVYFGEAAKPTRRVWIGNRQVPSVSYNVVTMHLEQKDAVRRLSDEITGAHRKEHDVKEHWCQSRKKGKGCTHKFALSDPKHGECVHGCGARIWWKKPHKRGDASLGTVSKTYKVTE